MGAPVFNPSYAGVRGHKPVMSAGLTGIPAIHAKYKRIERDTKMVAEMGAGVYSAYQAARQAYPVAREMAMVAGVI